MRILALDWGTTRIGGAISDPDGKIAFPLDKFIESKTGIEEIKKIVQDLEVEKILLGRPKSLAGEDTETTEAVDEFAKKLSDQVPCPIEYFDERLSSVGASRTLSESGINSKQQRGMVDNLAASQMLQSYIDGHRN